MLNRSHQEGVGHAPISWDRCIPGFFIKISFSYKILVKKNDFSDEQYRKVKRINLRFFITRKNNTYELRAKLRESVKFS